MSKVYISIVLFHNDLDKIKKVVISALDTQLDVAIYLIDNSDNDYLKILNQVDDRVIYIHNSCNIGFGAGHNIALRISLNEGVRYHLVLNPDVLFDNQALSKLYDYMNLNPNIGNISPKILYPDGQIQFLSKLLPSPFLLMIRRFFLFGKFLNNLNDLYELKFSGYDKKMNIPNLSGCFMFLRTSAIKEVGIFDENMFLYFEDVDLNRRIFSNFETIFYPLIYVYHDYAKDSYKNFRIMAIHIKSAIYYFNKWGWFLDKERRHINNKVLQDLKISCNK